MAKRKSKTVTNVTHEFIDEKFQHNTLRVLPFPPGMYDAINADALIKFPEPEVPMKEIKSFAGTDDNPEKIEDYENPEYKAAVEENNALRTHFTAEKILQFVLNECIEVLDVKKMENDIKRLSQYTEYPEDPHERVIKYVSTYVLSQKAHYTRIITASLNMTITSNEEVDARVDSFQD